MVFRSLLYGWVGAVLAGLVVAAWSLVCGIPEDRMIAVSTFFGTVLGSAGLCLPWARRRAVAWASRRG